MGNVAARDKGTVPHFVGRYEVLVPIASGGMATVYLARSRGVGGFEREVALKLTHLHLRESTEFESLLIEEAKLASGIRHNNVVSVLDVGNDPHGLFLVMDYVEGDTLSGLVRRARSSNEQVPRPIAMRVLLDALAGLHAAHETKDVQGNPLNLVHRDFSPQNILVGTDGVSKLTDFGIAKAASRVGHTNTGVLKGKIAYMSPEQARGFPLDRRADVWAAGVVAWEIVVGRPLWPRDGDEVNTLMKLVTERPARLRELDPSVSEALDEAVAKALTMDPGERWPTAAAFAKALAAAVERAEPEEVGEYVRTSAAQKIEQRRTQIRAMGELRARMGEITEASEMTPSGDQARVPPTRLEMTSVDSEGPDLTSGLQPSRTASSSVDAPDVVGPPLLTRTRALQLVGGVVALGVLVLAVALVRHTRQDDTTPSPSASSSIIAATTPDIAPVTVDTPTAMAPATTPQPIKTTTAITTASAPKPVATHGAGKHAASSPSATSALAPSPY